MTRGDDGHDEDDTAMEVSRAPLGRCPACNATIPYSLLLIEYESSSGRSRFAECPECREVVHPLEAS